MSMPDPRTDRDLLDKLAQEARVQRIAPILPEGPLDDARRKALRKLVKEHCVRQGYSIEDLAAATGVNKSYVSQLLNDKLDQRPEKRDELWRQLAAWCEDDARALRAQAALGDKVPVDTDVLTRLVGLARKLQDVHQIAIAYGPSGIGKSVFALQVAGQTGVVVLRADDDTRCRSGLLRKLYTAITGRRRQRVTLADVIEAFRPGRVKTRKLLVIDEAHQLPPPLLQTIRNLYDQAGVSVLLVGTKALRDWVADDEDPLFFGQFAGRVGPRYNLVGDVDRGGRLKLLTVRQIRQIYERGKVRLHAAAARWLTDIANSEPGHLHRTDLIVAWALPIARHYRRDEITAEDIRMARELIEDRKVAVPGAETDAAAATG